MSGGWWHRTVPQSFPTVRKSEVGCTSEMGAETHEKIFNISQCNRVHRHLGNTRTVSKCKGSCGEWCQVNTVNYPRLQEHTVRIVLGIEGETMGPAFCIHRLHNSDFCVHGQKMFTHNKGPPVCFPVSLEAPPLWFAVIAHLPVTRLLTVGSQVPLKFGLIIWRRYSCI